MPATSLGVAHAALERATEAIAALPVDIGAGVTMSVGVVRAALDSEPAVALAAADAAMYRAKHAGGNTVVSGLSPTASPVGGHMRPRGNDRSVGAPVFLSAAPDAVVRR